MFKKVVLPAAVLGMVSPMAFAAGESASILTAMAEYKVEVLLVIVGFAVILWAKRGGKLLNP